MYYLFGYQNIINLVEKSVSLGHFNKTETLLNRYNHHIQKISVFEKQIDWCDIKIADFDLMKEYCPSHASRIYPYIAKNSNFLGERIKNSFFENALNSLSSNHSEIAHLAKMIIKMIMVNHLSSYTNGTTDKTIGLASMDFKDHFLEQDFIELVVHQLGHMILFLDERLTLHCDDSLKNTMIETYDIKYRLGGTKFPAYLAFHSYLVGVDVLLFRLNYFKADTSFHYHGASDRIIRICGLFEKALFNHIHLFTERGASLLESASTLFNLASREVMA